MDIILLPKFNLNLREFNFPYISLCLNSQLIVAEFIQKKHPTR
jgi:hypothetical protein